MSDPSRVRRDDGGVMGPRHSEETLRVMAEQHITSEIERLVLCLPVQSQVSLVAHPIITQSLLEAFLVHLRSLADFVAVHLRTSAGAAGLVFHGGGTDQRAIARRHPAFGTHLHP